MVNGNGIGGSGINNSKSQVEDDVESFEFAVDENGKPIVDFSDIDSGTYTNCIYYLTFWQQLSIEFFPLEFRVFLLSGKSSKNTLNNYFSVT